MSASILLSFASCKLHGALAAVDIIENSLWIYFISQKELFYDECMNYSQIMKQNLHEQDSSLYFQGENIVGDRTLL